MATGTINIPSVAALECPKAKDRGLLRDDSLRGFGVVAFRNGGKCYIVQYRQHGRSRRARIGDHPSLTPAEARKLARKLLGAIEGGSDPLEERRKARAVPTFGEIAAEFMREHVATKRKERTARNTNASWRPTSSVARRKTGRRPQASRRRPHAPQARCAALPGQPSARAGIRDLELGGAAR